MLRQKENNNHPIPTPFTQVFGEIIASQAPKLIWTETVFQLKFSYVVVKFTITTEKRRHSLKLKRSNQRNSGRSDHLKPGFVLPGVVGKWGWTWRLPCSES